MYQKVGGMVFPKVIKQYSKPENMGGLEKNFNNLPGSLPNKANKLNIQLSSELDTIKSIIPSSDSILIIEFEYRKKNTPGIYKINGSSGKIIWNKKP